MQHAEYAIVIQGVTLVADVEVFLWCPGATNWSLPLGQAEPGELIAVVGMADQDLAQDGFTIHELQKALSRIPVGAEFDVFRKTLADRIAHLQRTALQRFRERSALQEAVA